MIKKVTYKLIALFLSFVLLANNINNIIIVTDFIINQDFIAQSLCVQKEDQKGCNGKCQLTKQLAQKNTDSNSNAPLPSHNKTHLDVFVTNATAIHDIKSFSDYSSKQNNIDYRLKRLISESYDIDSPPPDLSSFF